MYQGKKRYRGTSGKFIPNKLQKISKRITTLQKHVKYVARSGEMKHKDTTLSQEDFETAGVVKYTTICSVDQGTGDSQRIGRKIHISSIMLHLRLIYPDQITGTDPSETSNRVRIIVYQDTQTNGAAPAVTKILETADISSFYNLDNSKRFNILKNKFIDLQSPCFIKDTTFKTAQVTKTCNIYLTKSMTVNYIDTGNGLADIADNSVGVLLISQSDQSDKVNIKGIARIRYTD